jgi:hypothetical protein
MHGEFIIMWNIYGSRMEEKGIENWFLKGFLKCK